MWLAYLVLALGLLVTWTIRTSLKESAEAAYGFVYLYGVASWTVFAANLRAIAEHQVGADEARRVGDAVLRNFSCNVFTNLVFGAYGFSEHATHHRLPGIPYYRLPEATARLAVEDPLLAPRGGYLGTLVARIRSS